MFYLLGILVFLGFIGLKVLYQYERGVVFTLGKFSGIREPGLTWIFPIIQSMKKVDMRIMTVDVPRQEVITRDNIPVLVNTVVYFKVINPEDAIIKIENYTFAVREYTQAALRDVIGSLELDSVLTEREKVANDIKKIVDTETANWGIDIESINIQEIELPAEMKRAMAKQAESERERRAMIITASGELEASKKLQQAGEILAKSPMALQLRTLQTIRDIASDPSEKIMMFMPSDIGDVIKKVTGKK